MSENVWFMIVGGLTVAVVLALILNRKFRARWGDKEVETGPGSEKSSLMSMTATGRNARIERAHQVDETHSASMDLTAERGGCLKDVKQHSSKEDTE